MYVSEHFICFNSNIFGWVTNVMPVIPALGVDLSACDTIFGSCESRKAKYSRIVPEWNPDKHTSS